MGKVPKNRASKKILIFDEKARHEFLTGFKKRKDERRRKAQLQAAVKLKEEQKQMKEKHQNMLKKAQMRMQKEAKDVEAILQSSTITSEDHTVTVTYLGDGLMAQNKLLLGKNQLNIETEAKQSTENDKKENSSKDETKLPKTHKLTKRNKLVAKPSYKKSKHKSFTHEFKRGGQKHKKSSKK